MWEGLCGGYDGDVQGGSGGEGDGHFETELFPFARYEIGDLDWPAPRSFAALVYVSFLALITQDMPSRAHYKHMGRG